MNKNRRDPVFRACLLLIADSMSTVIWISDTTCFPSLETQPRHYKQPAEESYSFSNHVISQSRGYYPSPRPVPPLGLPIYGEHLIPISL